MSKKINRWCKLANDNFNLTLNKTNKPKEEIDFIEIIKKNFAENIKDNKLIYKGKVRFICDIKTELRNKIDEYEDISKSQNFSFIILMITIFSSMVGSAFLSNKDITIVEKETIFIVSIASIFLFLWGISSIEGMFNTWMINGKLFSKLCLQLLEDIEKEQVRIKEEAKKLEEQHIREQYAEANYEVAATSNRIIGNTQNDKKNKGNKRYSK